MARSYPEALSGFPLETGLEVRVGNAIDLLRAGVLERDAAGGAPDFEIGVLRQTGLLVGPWAETKTHPLSRWDQTLATISTIASVDPSAATLMGYHHMHLLLLADSGNPAIAEWATRETVANGWVWGGANNPSGEKVVIEEIPDGYRLNGSKEFATVSLVADQLIIQEGAPTEDSPLRRIVLAVDSKSAGLSVLDDWDGIGVVRSATNRILFDDVFVPRNRFVKYSRTGTESPSAAEAASAPGFQIIFANIYLGITLGVLRRAYAFLNGDATGAGSRRKSLSQVQEVFGELAVRYAAAAAVVGDVNRHFANTLEDRETPASDSYRLLSARVFPAKVFAHETVLEATQRVFEITGSRGATRQTGLEKFWRDARNHSLHDELRVRHRIVGAGLLGVEVA